MRAACVEAIKAGGAEAAWWFPTGSKREISQNTRLAKAICAGCQIRERCLSEAMETERGDGQRGRHGIFGGMTPGERYKLADRCRPCEAGCGRELAGDLRIHACSAECTRILATRRQHAYVARNRKVVPGDPTERHGSPEMAATGCTCVSCTPRRAAEERAQRVGVVRRARATHGAKETAITGMEAA